MTHDLEAYRCKECKELVLYRVDHKITCSVRTQPVHADLNEIEAR